MRDFTSVVFPGLNREYLLPPLVLGDDTAAMLQSAIARRLGVRYRFHGVDDRGYDCSGFVWRVFQDAGADFERVAARTLWRQLPQATVEETAQFGTLVFFNGLRHVGIVRDAYSFYHASRSHGVTVSSFSGYWGRRVTGFRRAPIYVLPEPFNIGAGAH
jgi:cell wall-associated NlpC family hydrolase